MKWGARGEAPLLKPRPKAAQGARGGAPLPAEGRRGKRSAQAEGRSDKLLAGVQRAAYAGREFSSRLCRVSFAIRRV
jgi:hypothetical protein